MSEAGDKGKITAEIGQDVIAEALKSVEKRQGGGSAEAEIELDPAVAPAADGASARETELQGELEQLKAQLEFSQAKGRELMEKIKDAHEKMLRAVADLDNFKKRAAKERDEVQRYGGEKLLKDFLPVLDNLERAVAHADQTSDFAGLKKGVAMTKKLLEDTFARHGMKGFSAAGQPFDPHRHEAMQQVETDAMPPNQVFQEVLRGFTLHERLIRPALVMVSKAKPGPAPVDVGQSSPADAPGASPSEGGADALPTKKEP